MNKKFRNKIITIKDYPTDLKTKLDLFKYRSEYILNTKNINWANNQDYKQINLEDFFLYIFGRNNIYYNNVLGEINLINLDLPFEDSYKNKREKTIKNEYVYNNITLEINKEGINHNWIVTKDLDTLNNFKNKDFVLSAPITYIGRNRNGNNARFLYAIAIDLDYVMENHIRDLIYKISYKDCLAPNIIVNSGNGCHIYYILKEPIPLFRKNMEILNEIKYGLIDKIWDEFTSCSESRQYQNVLQGYRLPNTKTKLGNLVECFINNKSSYYTIEDLNQSIYHPLSNNELNLIIYKNNYDKQKRLKELEELWPDWYQRRIINKEEPRKYIFKRTLYDWWLNKCKLGEEVKVGHRYYCALALVSFATKCGISKDEVKKDLYSLQKTFEKKTFEEDNHFLKEDIEDALEFYGKPLAYKFKREYISRQTGIKIKPNKRNGLKQKDHLKIARFTKEIKRKSLNIKGYNSNPYKTETIELIKSYVESGKYKSIIEISKETGLNRKTVTKYYNKLKNELNDKNLNIKEQNIYNLLKKNPKMSCNKISKETNISYVTVKKYYNNIKNIIDAEIKKEEFWENLID